MKAECPYCENCVDIWLFHICIECGEAVCFACYNPNQKKCCRCEKED